MQVRLSELAFRELANCEPDFDRRGAVESAIRIHMKHPLAPDRSIRLDAPIDAALFLFAMHKFRVIWQLEPEIRIVWSITLLAAYR